MSASKGKKVEKIRSFPGYKDIERLNRLMYKKEDITERSIRSSSTEGNMECSKADINTLIDILSRDIARTDKLESTVQHMASIVYNTKQ